MIHRVGTACALAASIVACTLGAPDQPSEGTPEGASTAPSSVQEAGDASLEPPLDTVRSVATPSERAAAPSSVRIVPVEPGAELGERPSASREPAAVLPETAGPAFEQVAFGGGAVGAVTALGDDLLIGLGIQLLRLRPDATGAFDVVARSPALPGVVKAIEVEGKGEVEGQLAYVGTSGGLVILALGEGEGLRVVGGTSVPVRIGMGTMSADYCFQENGAPAGSSCWPRDAADLTWSGDRIRVDFTMGSPVWFDAVDPRRPRRIEPAPTPRSRVPRFDGGEKRTGAKVVSHAGFDYVVYPSDEAWSHPELHSLLTVHDLASGLEADPIATLPLATPYEVEAALLELGGRTFLLASSRAPGLHVVALDDPTAPRVVGHVDLPGHVEAISVAGDLVHVALGQAGLVVLRARGGVVSAAHPRPPQEGRHKACPYGTFRGNTPAHRISRGRGNPCGCPLPLYIRRDTLGCLGP